MARQPEGKNQIQFVAAPGGVLLYGCFGGLGRGRDGHRRDRQAGTEPDGRDGAHGRSELRARDETRTVAPAPPPDKEERRLSAVKVHLESPRRAHRVRVDRLVRGAARSPSGPRAATIAYRAPEVAVPFKVTLLKFKSDKYPGSNMPATYESFVRVDDPESGLLRAPHLDEQPDALSRVHLLPSVVRGRHADDVDLLGSARPGPSSRLSRGDSHRGGSRLDVLSEAVPRAAPSRPGPRSSP